MLEYFVAGGNRLLPLLLPLRMRVKVGTTLDEIVDGVRYILLDRSLFRNLRPLLAFVGLAGATSRTAVSPFERLKILMQVQSGSGGKQQYTGIRSGLVKMWKEEGFKGYMKGNGINVCPCTIFPSSSSCSWSCRLTKTLTHRFSTYHALLGRPVRHVRIRQILPLLLYRQRPRSPRHALQTSRRQSRGHHQRLLDVSARLGKGEDLDRRCETVFLVENPSVGFL
jgi:hypothetical protein